MTTGDKQSFHHFTNQKQLKLTDDPNYEVSKLSGDASTDNRQSITEDDANTAAMELLQANSGMFMHPMHDVTQTEQVHGDKVLEALQVQLDELDSTMVSGRDGQRDPNEQQGK